MIKPYVFRDRHDWLQKKCRDAKSIIEIGAAGNFTFPGWDNVVHVDKDFYNYPNFVQADAHDLSQFADKSFDVAVLAEVLEHVRDPTVVLHETQRVANQVIITVPDPENWSPELRPYDDMKSSMERNGGGPEVSIMMSNPSLKKFGGNLKETFHQRWFNEKTFREFLDSANCGPHHVGKITTTTKPQWSWVVAEVPRKLSVALLSTPYITTPPEKYGGLERVVADLACGLSELGHKVAVFAANGSKPIGNYQVVECIEPLSNFTTDHSKVSWYDLEKKMFAACREQLKYFDVVHGHNWFCNESRLNQPNIFHTHHGGFQWETYPPNVHVLAISQHMKRVTEGYFAQKGIQIPSVDYAYNGIDLDLYKFQKEKGDRLLFVGRFAPFKGVLIAIDVAKALKIGLDVVGSPHDPAYFEMLKRAAAGYDIKFYLDVTQEDKIKFYQNAKCTLVPSQMGEPFGLVAIESLACGTPVVVLRDGALPELVRPVFVCDSGLEMATAIGRINPDTIKPEDCRAMAEQFSRLNMAKSYETIYNKILK